MKTWSVEIPVLAKEAGDSEERDLREYAMAIRFEIEAESAPRAAQILRERLEPTCSDP